MPASLILVGGGKMGGALLVRPDQHIAWRARETPKNPGPALRGAVATILEG